MFLHKLQPCSPFHIHHIQIWMQRIKDNHIKRGCKNNFSFHWEMNAFELGERCDTMQPCAEIVLAI